LGNKKLCWGGGGKVILDTIFGSGSNLIADYDLGFDFYACELDKDYFEAQEKRFNSHISQQKLFAPVPKEMGLQMTII
jgi:site-specific DNA-methyltransferase (adenine-specific)